MSVFFFLMFVALLRGLKAENCVEFVTFFDFSSVGDVIFGVGILTYSLAEPGRLRVDDLTFPVAVSFEKMSVEASCGNFC